MTITLTLTHTIIIFLKAHGMSYASRISNNNFKHIFYANFFRVSNEINPILVACFLGNK